MSAPSASATTYPPFFEEQPLASGLAAPTAVAWAPDGRMFVAEKAGRVRVVTSGGQLLGTPLIDLSSHVNNYTDRGLLGMAVDADFSTNHYLHLLYVYDGDPLTFDGPKTSRLTRVTVRSDNTVENPASPETVVLGSYSLSPCPAPSNTVDCIPAEGSSHAVGTVRADPDGTLWVGSGDAKTQSFRTYDEQSLAGKIVHIDRNGHGLPGHPLCPGETDLSRVCTKIYAKGFRNPYRFSLRGGGKAPAVGDVGEVTREELDLIQPGKNYGWPCYEGDVRTPKYADDSRCASLYAAEGTSGGATAPNYAYPHGTGNAAIVGGPTYLGDDYPAEYRGDIVIGDYAQQFLRRLKFDDGDRLTAIRDFASGWPTGVDLESAPNGNLVYVDINFAQPEGGSVREIQYAPGDASPLADAQADPTSAPSAPATVQFTGNGSSDPDGDTLGYQWDFGDGSAPSPDPNPKHTYQARGLYDARLTVDDGRGRSSTDHVSIAIGNPPAATILEPAGGALYRDGERVTLHGAATDPEDGALADSALRWRVLLHHGTHLHDLGEFVGAQASFVPLVDHDADSYYEVVLIAKDSEGLSTEKHINIHPQLASLQFASSPPGVTLTWAGVSSRTPFTRQAAVGFHGSLSAPATAESAGRDYPFQSWSDGGERAHELIVPPSAATFSALYRLAGSTTSPVPPPADSTAPVVRLRVPKYASSRSRSRTIRLRWSGADERSGLAGYTLSVRQLRHRPGHWRTLLAYSRRTSARFRGLSGRTYQFRLRGQDGAKLWSRAAEGETIFPLDDRSARLRFSPRWRTAKRPGAYGGTVHLARRPGLLLRLRFSGTRVALIATRHRAGARVRVRVDGRRRTISLRGRDKARAVVFVSSRLRPGRHTLALRTVGAGRAGVDAVGITAAGR